MTYFKTFIWILLLPLNILFSCLVFLKNTGYRTGIFKAKRLDRPVISIGNLAMGGTGKSPITSALASALVDFGFKVAILSRGYGRKNPKKSMEVLADSPWQESGDEPLMLRRKSANIRVFVGPSRWEAAQSTDYRPDVYLVDDGFQHRKLHRDLDIVLLDSTQPIPPVWPFFPFREGLRSLKRASIILITRCPENPLPPLYQRIKSRFPRKTILLSAFTFSEALDFQTLQPIKPQRVIAYSGIERPEKFFNALRKEGYDPVFTLSLKDHQELCDNNRQKLVQEANKRKVNVILTTEKDMVKLEKSSIDGMMVGFLPMNVRWHNTEKTMALLKEFMNRNVHEKTVRTT